ncbi:MAG: hypothetical protein A2087_14515 [Spirochaetes bacterium GWD1_61_31]|nr:MAG: hypothetical protein A2Y37_11025 [Spirochaetes bacterium GWB1_60_80]OHD33720.1 MAG: hypothetical protein A2004_09665 [Spirochaetes bacterium GWC1_61_12]OHD37312.1 MAG: hypothetical protein A2087_14515 [Spirochaetes bacterium GWD1_61_31]OHD45026.1 MAG: hypothetical protein A2Y35_13070 [Spirochaetes bacterium GWE1_60_18]OHD60138.1 MAG: hypothetical protein A2Y32_11180 [Spirochaetes bacterium GWF1_60_12]HAP43643.1 ATP:cob(I)alamin adenosyltransferase [Spirochaetaceae bacterium]
MDFDMVTTKGGDGGKSALYSGEFFSKDDIHFRVLGDIDELNSWLGVTRQARQLDGKAGLPASMTQQLHDVQQLLYRLMSVVATLPSNVAVYATLKPLLETDVIELEHYQRAWLGATPIEARFVIPGEVNLASAQLDYARALARRCERSLVDFIRQVGGAQSNATDLYVGQKYLNRLSDYLFVLARHTEL